jgi:uncharacterized Zn-binding protein involved in type VI secretion
MKNSIKVIIVLLIGLSFILGNTVTLRNNTVVVVKSNTQLSSDMLNVGQEIIMNVAADVKTDGVVVIKAGSPVFCLVQDVDRSQMAGVAGSILISVNSTTAVDGSSVMLSGQFITKADSEIGETIACAVILCPLALLNTGDEGIIPLGSQTRALTIGDHEIEVK